MTKLAQLVSPWSSGRAQLVSPWVDDVTSIAVVAAIDAGNVAMTYVNITGAASITPTIYVDVRSDVRSWWNVVFTLTGANGKRPIFQVERSTIISPSTTPPSSWLPHYSYDTRSFKGWTAASSRANIGGSTGHFEFQFDEAFTEDSPVIAMSPLMRVQDVDWFVNDMLTNQSSICQPAPCASTNGVFHTTVTENDIDGRAVGGHERYALLFDWGGSTTDGKPKRVCTVITHMHAQGEAIASIPFRYFLDYIMTSSEGQAAFLRSNWKFLVYAPHTANGLYGGSRRFNLRQPTWDPNRDWAVNSLDETRTMKTAILADVGSLGRWDAMLSWHGSYTTPGPANSYVVPEDEIEATRSPYTQAIATNVSSYLDDAFDFGSSGTYNTEIWWSQQNGTQLYIDAEIPSHGNNQLSALQLIGEAWAKSLANISADGFFRGGYDQLSSDGMLFLDPQSKEEEHTIPTGLMLNDTRVSDRFLQWLDTFVFGENSTQDYTPGGGGEPGGNLYTKDDSDGIWFGESAMFEYSLHRLSNLFLNALTAQIDVSAAGAIELLERDGLLLDDRTLSDRALRIMVGMLLHDSPMLDRALGMIDGLTHTDQLVSRDIDISRGSELFLDDRVMQMREMLWAEGMYLSTSAERQVLGVIISYLVKARLNVRDPLGVRLSVRDPLGVRIGVTDWE